MGSGYAPHAIKQRKRELKSAENARSVNLRRWFTLYAKEEACRESSPLTGAFFLLRHSPQ